MTHLYEYAKHITIGTEGKLTEAYDDWKKQVTSDYPECTSCFRALEKPSSWEELFRTMDELGFTQSDVLEHCKELEVKGRHALVGVVRQAADSEHSFKFMERG